MIDHKEQRYEIAVEVARAMKEDYDEIKREEKTPFNEGFLTGIGVAYMSFRGRLLSFDDIDEEKLNSLGVADMIWNVNIKDDDKHRAQEF